MFASPSSVGWKPAIFFGRLIEDFVTSQFFACCWICLNRPWAKKLIYLASFPEDEVVAPLTSSNIDVQAERVRNVLQDLSAKPTYRYRHDASEPDVIEESDMGLRRLFQEELGVEATLETNHDTGDRLLISGTIDPRHFNPRAWCYDTPGLESSQQVSNKRVRYSIPALIYVFFSLSEIFLTNAIGMASVQDLFLLSCSRDIFCTPSDLVNVISQFFC